MRDFPSAATAWLRPTLVYRITPTAQNDSQNPGHNNAQGSISKTTARATHNTCETLVMRPLHKASATVSNMYKVRCAGMPNPASST